MADEDIRSLQREVDANPGDEAAKIKLFAAKRRSTGQEFETYWKLRNKSSGLFANGRLAKDYYTHGNSWFSSKDGKQWNNMQELFKYIKKASEKKRDAALSSFIKHCEVIEYQTLTLESVITDIGKHMDKLELEMLRAERDANLKKIKELEEKEKKLLSKVEAKVIEPAESTLTKAEKFKPSKESNSEY